MELKSLMNKLEALYEQYPNAQINAIRKTYKDGEWIYRIYFERDDSGQSETYHLDVDD